MTETTIWWIVGALFIGYTLGRMRRGRTREVPTPLVDPSALPAHVLAEIDDALARGRKIEAIKLVRKATGLGLSEAKIFIDAHGVPKKRKGDPIS